MSSEVLQNSEEIQVSGVVTFETVALIQKNIERLFQVGQQTLSCYRINLAAVTLVNSSALGLMVELKKKALQQHKSITFFNLPEKLLSLAQVCGVSQWLELY